MGITLRALEHPYPISVARTLSSCRSRTSVLMLGSTVYGARSLKEKWVGLGPKEIQVATMFRQPYWQVLLSSYQAVRKVPESGRRASQAQFPGCIKALAIVTLCWYRCGLARGAGGASGAETLFLDSKCNEAWGGHVKCSLHKHSYPGGILVVPIGVPRTCLTLFRLFLSLEDGSRLQIFIHCTSGYRHPSQDRWEVPSLAHTSSVE